MVGQVVYPLFSDVVWPMQTANDGLFPKFVESESLFAAVYCELRIVREMHKYTNPPLLVPTVAGARIHTGFQYPHVVQRRSSPT